MKKAKKLYALTNKDGIMKNFVLTGFSVFPTFYYKKEAERFKRAISDKEESKKLQIIKVEITH